MVPPYGKASSSEIPRSQNEYLAGRGTIRVHGSSEQHLMRRPCPLRYYNHKSASLSGVKTRKAAVAAGLSSHFHVCSTKTTRFLTMFSLHNDRPRDTVVDTPDKHFIASETVSDTVYKSYEATNARRRLLVQKGRLEETIARFRP
jgi:hypothetical protein